MLRPIAASAAPRRAAHFAELLGVSAKPRAGESVTAENPFVKFLNDERGYVRSEVTPGQWKTDYKTVPFVSRPNAPLNTRASFVVESGQPKLQRA